MAETPRKLLLRREVKALKKELTKCRQGMSKSKKNLFNAIIALKKQDVIHLLNGKLVQKFEADYYSFTI
jgi:hypothetical protein